MAFECMKISSDATTVKFKVEKKSEKTGLDFAFDRYVLNPEHFVSVPMV